MIFHAAVCITRRVYALKLYITSAPSVQLKEEFFFVRHYVYIRAEHNAIYFRFKYSLLQSLHILRRLMRQKVGNFIEGYTSIRTYIIYVCVPIYTCI